MHPAGKYPESTRQQGGGASDRTRANTKFFRPLFSSNGGRSEAGTWGLIWNWNKVKGAEQ